MVDYDRRSSSPTTSESLSESHSDAVDFSAWCHFPPEDSPTPEPDGSASCNEDNKEDSVKMEESSIRMIQELLQSQICQPISPSSSSTVDPAVFHLSQSQQQIKTPFVGSSLSSFSSDNSSSDSAPVPELTPCAIPSAPMSSRAVPPPPVQTRRLDVPIQRRTVHPPKDTCFNLPILTPNIGPCGTKSRVETQVRVAFELAMPTNVPGNTSSYDVVGSWKWLKLPKGTATRKRSRKEGKIDASTSDTLFLQTEVTCASNPSKQVSSCNTCQGREAKRVARKIAARVRPARSDSESNDVDIPSSSRIVQFNCSDTLDFSSGSVVLPLRITCYCRHHREKVGFNVHFTLTDCDDRVIGRGISPPIMITDDHKSTDKGPTKPSPISPYAEMEWDSHAALAHSIRPVPTSDSSAPSRRTKDVSTASRRRAKPYDVDRSRTHRFESPESVSEQSTPSSIPPQTPCETTLYSAYSPFAPSVFAGSSQSAHSSGVSSLPSPARSDPSPVSPELAFPDRTDAVMRDALSHNFPFFPLSPPDTAPSSPPSTGYIGDTSLADVSPFNFDILHQPGPPSQPLPVPKIHRLIPSAGPTFGGIEVTVLGSNFHPSKVYNCVFGDAVSSSTTRWSENTLVCVLPPKATAGVVPVTLEGFKLDSGTAPALFTYLDETDRSLMELALQVVGLKMTGKIEDAKEIAMRIMGTQDSNGGTSSSGSTTPQIMNLANSVRLMISTDDYDFEQTIIDALTSLDLCMGSNTHTGTWTGISWASKTGQTMLHLASSRNFSNLVEALIQRDINLDAQDVNGYTALHFAVMSGSQCCARQIINAGADTSILSEMGYTAVELAHNNFFTTSASNPPSAVQSEESDDESHFGDGEEESETEARKVTIKSSIRRRLRHPRSRRSSKPASVAPERSDREDPEFDDNATIVSPESLLPLPSAGKGGLDEKQAASFADFVQRAWAQFQPTHLRTPPIPQLPGVPAWVFPVFVPMQAWPPFRSDKHGEGKSNADEDGVQSLRSPWDGWLAQMSTMAGQSQMGMAEAPSKLVEDVPPTPVAPTPIAPKSSLFRRFGYSQRPTSVAETEVQAYSYRPKIKAVAKAVKKEDRMLIWFWIPILIVALAWFLYASYPMILNMRGTFERGEAGHRLRLPA